MKRTATKRQRRSRSEGKAYAMLGASLQAQIREIDGHLSRLEHRINLLEVGLAAQRERAANMSQLPMIAKALQGLPPTGSKPKRSK